MIGIKSVRKTIYPGFKNNLASHVVMSQVVSFG